MITVLIKLLNDLHKTRSFEDVALLTLSRLLEQVRESILDEGLERRSHLIRAVLHLRPDNGYRGLVTLEADEHPPRLHTPDEGALFSATLWDRLVAHGSSMVLDVQLQSLSTKDGTRESLVDGDDTPRALGRSLVLYLQRGATHILLLPVRTADGIVGMISIEAECRAAVGHPFAWHAREDMLQAMADVAAHHLIARPLGHAISPSSDIVDELLPVVGRSMEASMRLLEAFAKQPDETLLLSGPTGSGKTRLAQWCHARSPRSTSPFLAPSLVGRSTENQLGELVGWRKGAFTDATRDNPGSLKAASGGTIFIDEIDKLALSAQQSLLRILDERRYKPLGNAQEQDADVRFIIGTNADLKDAVRKGAFLEDLYFRINVLPISLPPLDERQDEIEGWARFMLARHARKDGIEGEVRIDEEGLRALRYAAWPGNLRQLDNVIKRAYTLAQLFSGPSASAFLVQAQHIQRSLSFEGDNEAALHGLMEASARAFVRVARDAQQAGRVLSLDHTAAFRGYVLEAARQSEGDTQEAFLLFGEENRVRSRNAQRDYKRAQDQIKALKDELDQI